MTKINLHRAEATPFPVGYKHDKHLDPTVNLTLLDNKNRDKEFSLHAK